LLNDRILVKVTIDRSHRQMAIGLFEELSTSHKRHKADVLCLFVALV